MATSGDQIHVAGGTYKPDQDEAGNVTLGDRAATFHLISGVSLYGGYVGLADPGNPDERDIISYETILTGDLNSDDDSDPGSSCCAANGAPGCDDPLCQAAVCAEEPSCCDTEWSRVCALLALLRCCDSCRNTCENSYHVVTGSGTDQTAVLDGFTITAGYANGVAPPQDGWGGGMYNYMGSPTVANCTFRNNSANAGGGMNNDVNSNPRITNCTFLDNMAECAGALEIYQSSPTVTDCTFTGNSAQYGGGVENYDQGHPTLTNCTFTGNFASRNGGGMENYFNSSPTLINCTFQENVVYGVGPYVDFGGAGIDNGNNSSPTLTNCTFTSNLAYDYGGGVYNRDTSSPTLTGCVLTGNSANEDGGGIYASNLDIELINCTISGNRAGNHGGGIFGGCVAKNTIVWGNCADTAEGDEWYGDGSCSLVACCNDLGPGVDGFGTCVIDCALGPNIEANPVFCKPEPCGNAPTAEGKYYLCPGSPCAENDPCGRIGALGLKSVIPAVSEWGLILLTLLLLTAGKIILRRRGRAGAA